MEDPIEKLHDSAQGLAVWNFSLAVVETTRREMHWAFPLPCAYAGMSAPQSALSAPWFSQGNQKTLREEAKAKVLTRK